MQSVGEVMALGRTFPESLQKALRSLEQGRDGLNADAAESAYDAVATDELLERVATASPDRVFDLEVLVRRGVSVEAITSATGIDPWFLRQLGAIVQERQAIEAHTSAPDPLESLGSEGLRRAKRRGFSDDQLGRLLGVTAASVRATRTAAGVVATFKTVDTCAAEFEAHTPYHYSTYEEEDEIAPSTRDRVIILGSGPNRIGQGIEFDYCCVHAARALSEAGYETIMVNCNPETVSTDYDTSDRLYFEPLTEEDVAAVLDAEIAASRGDGRVVGVIVTLGGQTPLKLSHSIHPALVLGTPPESIDLAEDRERWSELCRSIGLRQPPGGTATTQVEARAVARAIGYPVLVRPSYVLGGRDMQIVYDDDGLKRCLSSMLGSAGSVGSLRREGGVAAVRPILIDRFLEDAIEVDVDALRDSTGEVFIAGVMEHVEEAGVHSGDSACALPPQSLDGEVLATIEAQTAAIADALGVVGPCNVQFAVKDGDVFVLEANPRASRTLPFVAKATGVSVAAAAARLLVGTSIAELRDEQLLPAAMPVPRHVSVKEAVLPFSRFPGVDTLLGPEMRSTGEVMGTGPTFGVAFAKSQLASGTALPDEGCVFFSLADKDKPAGAGLASAFFELGFSIAATIGTAGFLRDRGVEVATLVGKVGLREMARDAVELLENGSIQLVVNTPSGRGARDDGALIRAACVATKVPCLTTLAAGRAAASGVADRRSHAPTVRSLQELHA
jgi:carbamoyl-phosphate synthase large subunit